MCSRHTLRCSTPLTYSVASYLPSFPYQDNPVLHIYAGSICLYLSQDPDSRKDHKSPESLLEEAKAHFSRVITIDPGNCVGHIFLDQARNSACLETSTNTMHFSSDRLDPKSWTYKSGPRPERGRSLQLDARLLHRKCAKTDQTRSRCHCAGYEEEIRGYTTPVYE